MTDSGSGADGGDNRKDDDRSDSIFGWAYRTYQRFDKWKGRYEWFEWLLGFLKTNTATAVAVTSGATAATVAAVVVVSDPELRGTYLPFLGGTQTVETENWGSSVVYPIEGTDTQGRSAAFDVAVLPQNLTWSRQSDRDLNQGGTVVANADVPDQIFTPELRQGLGRSEALIAIGLASQEGLTATETARARRRGFTAANWLGAIAEPTKTIWVLNLGQFTGDCEAIEDNADTSWQRPLIVVGIRSQEVDVNLGEAFADAISDKSNLPSRECYTNFDLTRFR